MTALAKENSDEILAGNILVGAEGMTFWSFVVLYPKVMFCISEHALEGREKAGALLSRGLSGIEVQCPVYLGNGEKNIKL